MPATEVRWDRDQPPRPHRPRRRSMNSCLIRRHPVAKSCILAQTRKRRVFSFCRRHKERESRMQSRRGVSLSAPRSIATRRDVAARRTLEGAVVAANGGRHPGSLCNCAPVMGPRGAVFAQRSRLGPRGPGNLLVDRVRNGRLGLLHPAVGESWPDTRVVPVCRGGCSRASSGSP